MPIEHRKKIPVSILKKHTSIHPSKSLDLSKKPNVNKISRHHSLPKQSLVPIHYITHEIKEGYPTRHTIHACRSTNRLFEVNQIQSTDGTNIKGPLKYLRKNTLAITIVPRQQSKEWKQSHSVTSSTIQATIESSSLNKVGSTTTTTTICGSSCLNQSWIDSSGVIAFWQFENSFEDSTNVYNGTSSSQAPTFVQGYVGQAASFNASLKTSIYTSFIPLNNISFTVDAWIKQNAEPNPTDYSIVGLCPSSTTDNCLHINIRSKKYYFAFYSDDLQSVTTASLNRWTHVAFVFYASTRKQMIYINGVLDQSRTASGVLKASLSNFTIGTNLRIRTPNNSFQGYIDQLSINGRVKSSCEILEIATLSGHFKFDVASPLSDSGPNSITSIASNYLIISGHKNQAISFSGASTSYYQVSNVASFGTTNQSFSISFWIQPQILSGTIVHLSASSQGTGSECFPLLGFASNGSLIAQVLTKNNTIVAVTGPILSLSSSWTAIVFTWSETNGLKLYVNNALVSSMTASTFLASETTSNYLTLGNCLNGCSGCSNGTMNAAGPFTGAIDDWRIYSRELSSNDICTLYSN
ncbi:unnamed protein product [Rotaria sp. Silwood1]|nr:unnamed protein product [Rotaria sp. Silwood1]